MLRQAHGTIALLIIVYLRGVCMGKVGTYIVIEGTDGTGKSTQADILVERLEKLGKTVTKFHEPAGVPIANELRSIIVNGNLNRSALTNALLFTAARREVWFQSGLPALERGEVVVTTRNYYSTLAYQAIAEGLSLGLSQNQDIEYIEKLTLEATDERHMTPDCAIILDIDDEEERNRRIANRGETDNPDTFESRDTNFQAKIIEGYRLIANRKDIPVVSATKSPEEVAKDVWNIVSKILD